MAAPRLTSPRAIVRTRKVPDSSLRPNALERREPPPSPTTATCQQGRGSKVRGANVGGPRKLQPTVPTHACHTCMPARCTRRLQSGGECAPSPCGPMQSLAPRLLWPFARRPGATHLDVGDAVARRAGGPTSPRLDGRSSSSVLVRGRSRERRRRALGAAPAAAGGSARRSPQPRRHAPLAMAGRRDVADEDGRGGVVDVIRPRPGRDEGRVGPGLASPRRRRARAPEPH
jgi:hypothetical protein